MADETPQESPELPDMTGRFVIDFSGVRVLPEGTTEEEYEAIAQGMAAEFTALEDQLIDAAIMGTVVEDSDAFYTEMALRGLQRALATGQISLPEVDEASVPGLQLGSFEV